MRKLIVTASWMACVGCGVHSPVRLKSGVPPPLPTKITLGTKHGCALMNDGTVQCWGEAAELGFAVRSDDGWDAYRAYPVPGLQNVVRIAAGPDTTCALTRAGVAYCWGRNLARQVDWAVPDCRVATPEPAPELTGATDMAVGSDGVCAALQSGEVRCTTRSGTEVFRERSGSSVVRLTERLVLFADGTVHSLSSETFDRAIASGKSDLISSSRVYCTLDPSGWSCPSSAWLLRFVPTTVNLDYVRKFTLRSFSVENEHACGATTSGDVVCWGTNAFGELGRGAHGYCEGTSMNGQPVPCAGPGAVPGISDVVQVAVSPARSCALSKEGRVKCWGWESFRPAESDEALSAPRLHDIVFSPPAAGGSAATRPEPSECRFEGKPVTVRGSHPLTQCAPGTSVWTRDEFRRLARGNVGKRVRFSAWLAYARPSDDPHLMSGPPFWLGQGHERPEYRAAPVDPHGEQYEKLRAASGRKVVAEGRLESPEGTALVGFELHEFTLCEP